MEPNSENGVLANELSTCLKKQNPNPTQRILELKTRLASVGFQFPTHSTESITCQLDKFISTIKTYIAGLPGQIKLDKLLDYFQTELLKTNILGPDAGVISDGIVNIRESFIYIIRTTHSHFSTICVNNPAHTIENAGICSDEQDRQLIDLLYNNIKFWFYSICTIGIAKQLLNLTQPITINQEYLYFISSSYSIVDYIVDSINTPMTSSPQTSAKTTVDSTFKYIRQLIKNLDSTIPTPAKTNNTHGLDFTFNKLIESGYNKTKGDAVKYCLETEYESYVNQYKSELSDELNIQLTINKGISSGYLVLAGLELADTSPDLILPPPAWKRFCIMMQLLDDLADYEEDLAAGIKTSVSISSNYTDFALNVLDYMLDFLTDLLKNNPANKVLAAQFCYLWCYSVSKNNFVNQSSELKTFIREIYPVDPDYVLNLRAEKNKNKGLLARLY